MRRPPTAGVGLATDQTAAGNVGQRRCLAVTETGINVLTTAGPAACQQRRQDAVARVQARRQVGHGDTYFDGCLVALAGNVHETKFGLDHDVVARAAGVGSCLAVACDGGIDEFGVEFVDRLIVHAVLGEGSREIVFDEDVALGGEFVEDLDAGGVLEGERERLFVAVGLEER